MTVILFTYFFNVILILFSIEFCTVVPVRILLPIPKISLYDGSPGNKSTANDEGIPSTTFRPWWIPAEKQEVVFSASTTASPTKVEIPVDCGKRNNSFRVVGGQKAGYWPWIVGLLGRRGLFCGGSLVTNYHILTAAHCVVGLQPRDLRVRVGDMDLSNSTDTRHLNFDVKSFVIHPDYDIRTNHNDLAIIKLKSKVEFDSDVFSICLPKNEAKNYAGKSAIVIGWGASRIRGPTSKVLMELNMRVWSVSECQARFKTNYPNRITSTNICAGDRGKDACSGDSGGPLMEHENGVYTQIGIVSWGIACGRYRYPGVYTRVTSYLDWIKDNLLL